jgi:hypothetical protein
MDGGSDWVALSRPFVAYVASAVEQNNHARDPLIEGLNTIFKHTLLPAEVSMILLFLNRVNLLYFISSLYTD